jgi:hypothetical protein
LWIQAIPSALGVSSTKQYQVNSLAVPRKAKEAIGGITRLTHSDGKLLVSSLIDKEILILHAWRFYSNLLTLYYRNNISLDFTTSISFLWILLN